MQTRVLLNRKWSEKLVTLFDLTDFGAVAAEDDDVLLDYFLSTQQVSSVEDGSAFLILGRKGSGKTAIVRHFSEGSSTDSISKALSLRSYPWNTHASRKDLGASDIESYVASWRYLIAVEIATRAVKSASHVYLDEKRELSDFLTNNYGGIEPKLGDILQPEKLSLSGFQVAPSILGNQLGSITLERKGGDKKLGAELNVLSDSLLLTSINVLKSCSAKKYILHFDELDHGLDVLDTTRAGMIVGLIVAARELRKQFLELSAPLGVAVYLRTDLWDDLKFSDKNKIAQSQAVNLNWDHQSLLDMINIRISAKLGSGTQWNNIIDDQLMRGSQQKWRHIISRTMLRPRDVIQFLNIALRVAKRRKSGPQEFINKDIVTARSEYSTTYFKQELDDEVSPHWPQWEESLQALTAIGKEVFEKSEFSIEYGQIRSEKNNADSDRALELMYRFSVIGYQKRSGYGGSGWAFRYEDPNVGWDALSKKFKVHPGLKEFAKIKEGRN